MRMATSDQEKDLETGISTLAHKNLASTVFKSAWGKLRRAFCQSTESCEMHESVVEDYPQGYPRYSAFISADRSFHVFRRFSHARTRLLLLKQDKVAQLEERLQELDAEEKALLFLGNCRSDANIERQQILSELDSALSDYDAMTMRSSHILNYAQATQRNILSLQNWVNNNACIARNETAYLTHCNDLLELNASNDSATERLETWIEDKLIRFYKLAGKRPSKSTSRDAYVYIFPGSLKARTARGLVATVVVAFLLAPMMICNAVTNSTSRTAIVVVATVLLVAMLSFIARARTVEMFVTGTAYATVLVVFITSTSSNK